METVILFAVLFAIGLWVYRLGKSTGSRKAYGVGYRRGKRRR
jgi:hypothetical protein